MKYLIRITLPLLSLFLAYRSLELMKFLMVTDSSKYSFMESFIFAFLLTLFITGVFAFVGFAYPTSKIIPNSYYNIKYPDLLRKVSGLLGVKYFRTLLIFFFGVEGRIRKSTSTVLNLE